jgi:hypothetical protein
MTYEEILEQKMKRFEAAIIATNDTVHRQLTKSQAAHLIHQIDAAILAPLPPLFEEWKDWNGGTCPVPPLTRVDIVYRSNEGLEFAIPSGELASVYTWAHSSVPDPLDIVAYRVHK